MARGSELATWRLLASSTAVADPVVPLTVGTLCHAEHPAPRVQTHHAGVAQVLSSSFHRDGAASPSQCHPVDVTDDQR